MTRERRLFIKNTSLCQTETLCTKADACSLAVSQTGFQPGEGLLKGGTNSESLKVSYKVALTKSGYMLENPSILHYPNTRVTMCELRTISRKGQTANQSFGILRDCTPDNPTEKEGVEDTVRSAQRCAEASRNA